MSGLIAIAGDRSPELCLESLVESINLSGTLVTRAARTNDSLLANAQHETAPVYADSIFEDDSFIAVVAGDIVNHSSIDWNNIRAEILGHEHPRSALQNLQGAFAIALFDKPSRRLFVVSDPFSWQSVYFARLNGALAVSTSLATFFRINGSQPGASTRWLYELLYFNYGVLSTTPLEGVHRLSAGTILEYRLAEDRVAISPYRDKPPLYSSLLAGQDGIDEAVRVFSETVPEYFQSRTRIALSLSNGLDCRAMLAAVPGHLLDSISSLTFGLPDSSEILECGRISEYLGFQHLPVYLDRQFIERLPALARETIYISSGAQNINRTHLLYTYSRLRKSTEPFDIFLTGVSGDHIFRDHIQGSGNVPHIMSADAARQLCNGRHRLNAESCKAMVGNAFPDFEARIENVLDELTNEHGNFGDPYTYLCYLMFEAGPRYFGGQLELANAYSTFRSPYWDSRIIDLGFRLQDATLGFSSTMARKDLFHETRIQASIVDASPVVRNIPYRDLPISVFSRGNKAVYQVHRGLRKLRTTFGWHSFVYTENWKLWYQTALNSEIQQLLGRNSRLRDYVSARFIERAIAEADVHWLGKLATAELTLRHIENGWKRLDDQLGDK